jgi:hypothetical protein
MNRVIINRPTKHIEDLRIQLELLTGIVRRFAEMLP